MYKGEIVTMSIEVKNVSKVFGKQKAVDRVDFSIQKGQITGFLGPNGAGKSTTMKMICSLLKPDEGQIKMGRLDVLSHAQEIKENIGYLPESNPLYKNLYVREFLHFMASLHQLKNKKERIEEVIQLTGLRKEAGKKIRDLSKGYKQRVGLAQAILHDPDYLILDEPTSGLDPNQLAEIRDLILNLGKDKGVLFSSHIMQEIQAICDRVVVINDGKIVANESIEDLQDRWKHKQRILLEISGKDQIENLKSIPGIQSVVKLAPLKYELTCAGDIDVREKIYASSIDHKFSILEMSAQKLSMELIFKELTGN